MSKILSWYFNLACISLWQHFREITSWRGHIRGRRGRSDLLSPFGGPISHWLKFTAMVSHFFIVPFAPWRLLRKVDLTFQSSVTSVSESGRGSHPAITGLLKTLPDKVVNMLSTFGYFSYTL